ncbi:MAG: hypothetical protein IPP82_14895 [Xanthomonadales bacterium]|nr:hypothetical protein [Xanthomonadales bacterium]
MKSAPTIAFDYRPCRGVAIAIVSMTVLAMVAILASDLPIALKLLLTPSAFGYGILALRRHWRAATVRIARGAAGWLLVDMEGLESPVRLADHVHRGFLVVLGFRKDAGAVQRFVLTPDNSDADLRRRLQLVVAASKDSALPTSAT